MGDKPAIALEQPKATPSAYLVSLDVKRAEARSPRSAILNGEGDTALAAINPKRDDKKSVILLPTSKIEFKSFKFAILQKEVAGPQAALAAFTKAHHSAPMHATHDAERKVNADNSEVETALSAVNECFECLEGCCFVKAETFADRRTQHGSSRWPEGVCRAVNGVKAETYAD